MKDTLRVEWISPVNDKDIIGNSLGYGLANKNLKTALEKQNTLEWRKAPALHFVTPQFFFRIPNKKNYIMTMCEHEWLSDDYKIAFEKADAIITVSNFCKSVFERYTDKPIYVCPLGVDTSIWTAKKRVFKPGKQKFRWLYCGAPNLRKFSIMEEVWKIFLKDFADVELYIKTTGADIPEELGDIVHSNNWIIDNRKLNIKDLVKLYHSAHAMVFLHLGEGYGLTALEAMATQMPVVVSNHTGTLDFCNKTNSFPVSVDMGKIQVLVGKGGDVQTKEIDAGIPSIISAMTQMASVMYKYDKANDIARQAVKDARKLTWENAAKRLKEIIENLDSPSVNLAN